MELVICPNGTRLGRDKPECEQNGFMFHHETKGRENVVSTKIWMHTRCSPEVTDEEKDKVTGSLMLSREGNAEEEETGEAFCTESWQLQESTMALVRSSGGAALQGKLMRILEQK